MISSRFLVSLAILTLAPMLLGAQEMRYGKYSDLEFSYNEVDFEPDADAVVLQESCYSFFSGIVIHNQIHRRIKVLKESGKEQANVILRYYKGENKVQDIFKIKAQTINSTNGEIEIEELSKTDFFEADAGEGWHEIRFTFPNVQIGSIMEFSYEKTDKSVISLDGWVFQNEIPTLKSIFDITFPDFLKYKTFGQGIKTISHNSLTNTNNNYRWELENLNAFRPEPYMAHYTDYLEKVAFQLEGYEMGQMDISGIDFNTYKKLFNTWQDLADFFTGSYHFERFLEPKKEAGIINEIGLSENDTLRLATDIYEYASSQYNFSGISRIIPSKDFSEMLSSKNGDRAEINLSLLAHLRQYGIVAFPVLISSKGNGRSNLVPFPYMDQFNELIIVSLIGNKIYFLDATDPNLPFGFLPENFLVNQGFLLMEENSGLIDIQIPHSSGYYAFSDITLEDEHTIKRESSLKVTDFDYVHNFGIQQNETISQEEFEKIVFTGNQENIETISINENKKYRNQLSINYTSSKELNGDNTLYINPFYLMRWQSNPFISSTRAFPIDFNYTFTDRYATNIKIPEGYILDDFPENTAITLPGGAITFNFVVNVLENIAAVNAVISVKTHIIGAVDYPDLRYMIDIISSKFKEPLVLVKSSSIAPTASVE